jgi:signal transduction histidine kinase
MPGGGTLTIASRRAPLNSVEIRVADQGVGIPPENLDKIFRLYFTTKAGGSGIGLAMVYRIVQMHDGRVDVESTAGKGTTVVLTLPVSPESR